MTPSEFKAWFEGFCEAIDGKPTDAQWERVKEQMKKISAPLAVEIGRAFPAKPLPALPSYPYIGSPYLPAPTGVPLPRYPITYSVGGQATTGFLNVN